MTKKEQVDQFSQGLTKIKVSHLRQSDYHVTVSHVHQFYPSKLSYYNTGTGKKSKYTFAILKDHNAFMQFLRDNQF